MDGVTTGMLDAADAMTMALLHRLGPSHPRDRGPLLASEVPAMGSVTWIMLVRNLWSAIIVRVATTHLLSVLVLRVPVPLTCPVAPIVKVEVMESPTVLVQEEVAIPHPQEKVTRAPVRAGGVKEAKEERAIKARAKAKASMAKAEVVPATTLRARVPVCRVLMNTDTVRLIGRHGITFNNNNNNNNHRSSSNSSSSIISKYPERQHRWLQRSLVTALHHHRQHPG